MTAKVPHNSIESMHRFVSWMIFRKKICWHWVFKLIARSSECFQLKICLYYMSVIQISVNSYKMLKI